MKRYLAMLLILLSLFAAVPAAFADEQARAEMIDRIIATAKQLYDQADGKLQRAQYSGDIYVCKNYTVYLFRQNRDDFRMAEFPSVSLVIPDNLNKQDCAPYNYGVAWKDVAASDGNPFEIAETFRYDTALSEDENRHNAQELMMQVERGDYFQMSADYYYGKGAHSLVFTDNYDPETKTVHWTDSNMKGEKKNGERYGLVQYDAVKDIDWFVDAFCHKKRGATLYRLRDDIVFASNAASN
jgi:hypothetical protein